MKDAPQYAIHFEVIAKVGPSAGECHCDRKHRHRLSHTIERGAFVNMHPKLLHFVLLPPLVLSLPLNHFHKDEVPETAALTKCRFTCLATQASVEESEKECEQWRREGRRETKAAPT